MNTHNNREPENKLAIYTRRSQKGRDKQKSEIQEIREANLFVYLKSMGLKESNIVVF